MPIEKDDVLDRGVVHDLGTVNDRGRPLSRIDWEDGGSSVACQREASDGSPMMPGEVLAKVRLSSDGRRTVEVVHGDIATFRGKGPAQVASEAYRTGWDLAFGDKGASN